MLIVGVDPSYTCTGVATYADTRSLRPPMHSWTGSPATRAAYGRSWIRGQLAPIIRRADVVAVEGLYPATQAGWLDRAFLLGAIIDQVITTTEAALLIVAPASAKILATGNGGPATDKPAMLAAAEHADSPARNGDEADAWWIAELARLVVDQYANLSGYAQHRRRALDPYRPPYKTDPWIRHPNGDPQ